MVRFAHLADIHLGYEQYGLKQRAQDIARALRDVISAAIDDAVDLVLIAGDVFHNRNVDPPTLMTAVALLAPLRERGIPVVAVAGNHDRGWREGAFSWLSLLDYLGYLVNLDVRIDKGVLHLGHNDRQPRSIYETGEMRVVGLPYLGAALPRLIGQLAEALSSLERKYTVLLTHAGIEGEMPGFSQPLEHRHLQPLEGLVDYIALGHLHKPFERDGWVYNPGSLEALAVDEVQFGGGRYVVTVEQAGPHRWQHAAELIPYRRRRPFLRQHLDISGFETVQELEQAVQAFAMANLHLAGKRALVEIYLRGHLRFAPSALDLNALVAILEQHLQPLRAAVRNGAQPTRPSAELDEDLPRRELEQMILEQCIAADTSYAPWQGQLARLALELKEMSLAGADDQAVFQRALAEASSLKLGMLVPADAD